MKSLLIVLLTALSMGAFAQSDFQTDVNNDIDYKYRVSLPLIILPQLVEKAWDDRIHTQHIEFHVRRNLDNKNIVGIKFATWRLFQPMGILWWDGLLDKIETESEFYPGHVRETGLGITYQRMLWKGLFTTIEVLPLFQTYLDEHKNKVGNGFKLYNSIHLGYHTSFGKKKRFFLEPQIHSQFWIDTKAPSDFKELDDKWKNYFLFEPNIYFGVKF
ncbi:hypothetical protein [Mangrovivirga cuniculi]|uniref:DUF3575 domain-containing protein n=1 Tax=Mangrovivirga cuniculi TaxID=2715131 RepID=A0A4D7JGR6_9BACT|nr:hypothetical protein [Mangrovivirga cuniculi]QCK14283.1 hypothetical protein DCC35_05750 [Mangrovivirga cuniculi]